MDLLLEVEVFCSYMAIILVELTILVVKQSLIFNLKKGFVTHGIELVIIRKTENQEEMLILGTIKQLGTIFQIRLAWCS